MRFLEKLIKYMKTDMINYYNIYNIIVLYDDVSRITYFKRNR